MKITDAIAAADALRINQVEDEQKARWLYELECRVAEVMGRDEPEFVFPSDKKLLLPTRFEDVYVKYLCAMVDAAQGEGEAYVNDMAVFEKAFTEFGAWYLRTNRPPSSGFWRV